MQNYELARPGLEHGGLRRTCEYVDRYTIFAKCAEDFMQKANVGVALQRYAVVHARTPKMNGMNISRVLPCNMQD